jgi:co-chaperonin GroES (HSP10)
MGSLIVPAGIAAARRRQLEQPRGMGLGKAHHDVDPREKIFKQIGMTKPGEISGLRIHGSRVLVGVYIRPDTLASGIKISDQTINEDVHQGKAGLVLMRGHSAFRSDSNFDFGPDEAKIGEWVMFFHPDGRKTIINGQLCRVLKDQDIAGVIPSPDAIY